MHLSTFLHTRSVYPCYRLASFLIGCALWRCFAPYCLSLFWSAPLGTPFARLTRPSRRSFGSRLNVASFLMTLELQLIFLYWQHFDLSETFGWNSNLTQNWQKCFFFFFDSPKWLWWLFVDKELRFSCLGDFEAMLSLNVFFFLEEVFFLLKLKKKKVFKQIGHSFLRSNCFFQLWLPIHHIFVLFSESRSPNY